MRVLLTAGLLFLLGLIYPVCSKDSAFPDNLEGSGFDQEGSASGEWPETVSMEENTNVKSQSNRDQRFTVKPKHFNGYSDLMFDGAQWAGKETVVEKIKKFLENKETLAGVISGGVAGLTLAIVLAGILIYKWQKKDDRGYILGQQRPSDDDCRRPREDEVVVV